jgi:DNA-binding transcriptional MerR regulator
MLFRHNGVSHTITMKIGELAHHTGTQVETIRYYEREGLLPETARTDGNYRIYGTTHADRLRFIRNCRSLDMTLDEIRLLLRFKDSPAENCGGVNELLDEHIGTSPAASANCANWNGTSRACANSVKTPAMPGIAAS